MRTYIDAQLSADIDAFLAREDRAWAEFIESLPRCSICGRKGEEQDYLTYVDDEFVCDDCFEKLSCHENCSEKCECDDCPHVRRVRI